MSRADCARSPPQDPLPEPGLDPGPVIAYTRRLHVYATAHELDAPVFETIAVAPPLYEARVTFDGHKCVARGQGPRGARSECVPVSPALSAPQDS